MNQNKYKILVLSDLKSSTDSVLLNTVSLAKMIDADIEFFHVKKPIDIVEKENQLSAKRTINKEHFDTDKKIKNLLEPFSIDYNRNISSSFSFGNVKDEILNRIKKVNPDVIVLGKRKSSPFKIIGDNITDFVLKNYNGNLFIASEKNSLKPDATLSMGIFESFEASQKKTFANEIMDHSKKPLKAFKIGKQESTDKNIVSNKDVIEYVFEQNDGSISNLSNYLSRHGINVFCVNRSLDSKQNASSKNFKEVLKKVDVSVLLSN